MTAPGDGRGQGPLRGSDAAQTVRDANLALILGSVRHRGAASRSRLHVDTGVSRRTIGLLTEKLLALGVLTELPVAVGPTGRRGRPEVPLALHPQGRVVLGVHVRPTRVSCSAVDLAGTVIDTVSAGDRSPGGDRPATVLRRAAELAARMAERTGADRVVALGVSIGGVVDRAAGRVIDNPARGWRDVDLRGPFERVGPSVVLGSSADALAVQQHLDGVVPATGLNLTVFVSGLVGAVITMDGRLLDQTSTFAPTSAHFPVAGGPGVVCDCGRRDCLGILGGARTLHTRAVAAGLVEPDTSWNAVETPQPGDSPALVRMRLERAELLGESIAAMIELLSPRRTVLRGWLGSDDDVDACLRTARARCRQTVGVEPSIDYGPITPDVWDGASASLALDGYLHAMTRHEPAAWDGSPLPS